jgi:hypothetical protein
MGMLPREYFASPHVLLDPVARLRQQAIGQNVAGTASWTGTGGAPILAPAVSPLVCPICPIRVAKLGLPSSSRRW